MWDNDAGELMNLTAFKKGLRFRVGLIIAGIAILGALAAWGTHEHANSQAVAVERIAVDIEPKRADLWVRLGNAYSDREAWRDAEKCYKKVLTLDGTHYDKEAAWRGLAGVYRNRGLPRESEYATKRAESIAAEKYAW